jgi:hypothetical protein
LLFLSYHDNDDDDQWRAEGLLMPPAARLST